MTFPRETNVTSNNGHRCIKKNKKVSSPPIKNGLRSLKSPFSSGHELIATHTEVMVMLYYNLYITILTISKNSGPTREITGTTNFVKH